MENIIELDYLLKPGNIGFFSYCEVTQIILYIKSSKEYWNYFTNINCSSEYTQGTKRTWLTEHPQSINDKIQVLISKQIIPIKEMLTTWNNAEKNNIGFMILMMLYWIVYFGHHLNLYQKLTKLVMLILKPY